MTTAQSTQHAERLPKRRALPQRTAGQEDLVRDPEQEQVHFLNAAASVVWEACDGQMTLGECERRMRAKFDIPAQTDVIADIRAAVADFAKRGLLEENRDA